MTPSALFFDIDGTLVSFHTHEVPESAVDALREAKRRGVRIFIATGRHCLTIDNLGEVATLVDGYVTLNGACCIVDGKVIRQIPIPPPDVKSVIGWCDRFDCACVVVSGRGLAVYNPKPTVYDIFVGDLHTPGLDDPYSAEEILRVQQILQLTPFVAEGEDRDLMGTLESSISARWHPAFTDITARGADKGEGLAAIVSHLGLDPARTMAFGDGGNDIPLLRASSLGIAMENAMPELKAVADHVTSSVDDDGIARALRHFGVI